MAAVTPLRRLAIFFAAFLTLPVTAAAGQAGEPESRAEALRRMREAKQKELEPPRPSALERAMDIAENRIFPLLNRDGIYAKFGSLTTGSGLAYGGGFRDRSLVKGRGFIDAWMAGSLKKYWAMEVRGGYPLTPGPELSIEGWARQHSYPQEEFFGLGPDSRRPDRSVYKVKGPTLGAGLNWKPVRHVTATGSVERFSPTLSVSRTDDVPSVEDVFAGPDLPGTALSHRFLRTAARVAYDYRQPLNARKGGFYQLELSRYDDRRYDAFTFTRTDLDLRQYFSILAERRVFALRARVSTTGTDDDQAVPFFLQPTLGGNDTLRGFRAYRFRGLHSLLLQAEYRWEIWSGLEGALFYDTGKVAMRRSALDFTSLERDYGFGFRFNTDNGVVMRVDAAFGSRDGRHLHVVFGGIF
jgi:hypothetical protein